jgi:Phosphodiester glycosidase
MAAAREIRPETGSAGAPAVSLRVRLGDGAGTTVYIAAYALDQVRLQVVTFKRPEPLLSWCRRNDVEDAIVGGFFTRPRGEPLGELRIRGGAVRTVPFTSPWDRLRSCVYATNGRVALAPRSELPRWPQGDLLQAGPLLVRDGRSLIVEGRDSEGFSAGRGQFDSDITAGRYPRAAFGVREGLVWLVACDGRGESDAGMTLVELAELMLKLGARDAINLDGGGSTSLVSGGRLVNRPREEHGLDLPAGRPITTALVLLRR